MLSLALNSLIFSSWEFSVDQVQLPKYLIHLIAPSSPIQATGLIMSQRLRDGGLMQVR